MNVLKFLSTLKGKAVKAVFGEQINEVDLGILKVAFMIAGLDGVVSDEEFDAFDAMAKKCRGYKPELAAAALEAAMRSTGYLMLLSRRCTDEELVAAFMREADAALPRGFAYCSPEDVRRAVATWVAMGMSDGDYSHRERLCIEALRRQFAQATALRRSIEGNRDFAPIFNAEGAALGGGSKGVTRQDVRKIERLVSEFSTDASAAKELKTVIANG